MGIVVSFIPWIVYWILVGNVAFQLAVTIAFAIALLGLMVTRASHKSLHTLDVGNIAVFAALVLAAYVVPTDTLERWLQPLSNAGLFLIVLVGVLIGRPFVREYAVAAVDEQTAKTDSFRAITVAMTWMWVVAFGGMTVSSLIPPIVDGDATILDMDDTLGILCYWVIPFTLLGIAGAVSAMFPPWFEKRSAQVDTRTGAAAPVARQPADRPAADTAGGLSVDAPADSRFDEPFSVAVSGAAPGGTLTVRTSGQDLFGRSWRSSAEFAVPATGSIDLATTAPTGATSDWRTPDGTAPIWAMRFAADDAVPEMFVPPAEPWQVTLEATAGTATGRRTVVRRGAAEDVRFEPTTLDGLPGMLVLPAGDAPAAGWPGVACFSGSEGGFESQLGTAALLASRGYAALSQAWISEDDAATAISGVPLERFGGALRLLGGRAEVDASAVVGLAISRGSEGLLAAAVHGQTPEPAGLVLVSPSCVTWQAIGSSGEVPDTSSWTLAGRPVPWVPLLSGSLLPQLVRNAWTVGKDIQLRRPSLLRLRPAYESSLRAAGVLDDNRRQHGRVEPPAGAVLDAAGIGCPVLMLCGSEDEVWPSGPMASRLAGQRAGGHPGDDLVVYEGAGHLIRFGLLPTDAPWTSGIAFGGTRAAQAAAQADATRRLLEFLGAAVTSRA
jgi:dienelactone hydrolase